MYNLYYSFFANLTNVAFAVPSDFVIFLNMLVPSVGPSGPTAWLLEVCTVELSLSDLDNSALAWGSPSCEFVLPVELGAVASFLSFSVPLGSCDAEEDGVTLSGLSEETPERMRLSDRADCPVCVCVCVCEWEREREWRPIPNDKHEECKVKGRATHFLSVSFLYSLAKCTSYSHTYQ